MLLLEIPPWRVFHLRSVAEMGIVYSQSGLLTRTATTGSVSLSHADEKLTTFLKLESVTLGQERLMPSRIRVR